MKRTFSYLGLLALPVLWWFAAGGNAFSACRCDKPQKPANAPETTSPFMCRADAMNPEQRERWGALLKQLAETRRETRELPDGYAFRFQGGPSVIRNLAEWIALERLCCPFFRFELRVEPEGGPVWLHLTGPEGVKDFIRAEFDANS